MSEEVMSAKDKEHLRVLNTEMGSVDTRLGNIEGSLKEALPDIKEDIHAIFGKFEKLPCSKHGERITSNETLMKNIMKTRYIVFTALASGLVTFIIMKLSGA